MSLIEANLKSSIFFHFENSFFSFGAIFLFQNTVQFSTTSERTRPPGTAAAQARKLSQLYNIHNLLLLRIIKELILLFYFLFKWFLLPHS